MGFALTPLSIRIELNGRTPRERLRECVSRAPLGSYDTGWANSKMIFTLASWWVEYFWGATQACRGDVGSEEDASHGIIN